MISWTPDIIDLFHELKVSINYSPVLSHFDQDKPIFLKTDWSAEGMGWILMQPSDDEEFQKFPYISKIPENNYSASLNMAPA